MSGVAPVRPDAASRPQRPAPSWQVRAAAAEDVTGIAAAVRELLLELGGTPPAADLMQATARALLDDGEAGALLVARAPGALVGVLAASWQTAIHVGGDYALIQDLWVDPAWRGRTVGATLLQALVACARERGIGRIEVGLPHSRFAALGATEAFYRENGFEQLGPRMRRALS